MVDYDSAERSLRAVDRNGILFIREDLYRVCDYLCERNQLEWSWIATGLPLPSILFNDVKAGFKNTIEKGVYLASSGENSGLLVLSSEQIAQRLTEALAA
jgi:hypothetical protein